MHELPKRPVLSEKDNAAPFYREAVNVLPDWTPEDQQVISRMLDPAVKLKPGDRERLDNLFTAIVPAIKKVRQGLAHSHCDFGWRLPMDEEEWKQRREVLLSCDRIAQVLQVYALGHRDPKTALKFLEFVQQFTRHLTEEPGLLVWQSRSRHAALATRTLLHIAEESPGLRDTVRQTLDRWRNPTGVLKKVWMLQCVKEQDDAQRSRTRAYESDKEPFLDYNPLWRELDRLDHTLGWQLYADASEVINLRYWRAVKSALAPIPDDDLTAQWRALKTLDTAEDKRGKAFAGYWYPQRYSGLASQLLTVEASCAFLNVVLHIRIFQSEHKKLPTSLSQLPAGVSLTDPFSGKPFRWKTPLLYSVGFDEKDDGGDAQKDLVRDLSKQTAPLVVRNRRGAMRRPGRTAGRAE
jgi:hypothetical protein